MAEKSGYQWELEFVEERAVESDEMPFSALGIS